MKRHLKYICLIPLLILCFSWSVNGQVYPRISGDFTQMPFPEFIKELEKNSSLHFFYDPSLMDTLKVNIRADDTPLDQVLKRACDQLGFHLLVQNNNLFITQRSISSANPLTGEFFQSEKDSAESASEWVAVQQTDSTKTTALQPGIENRLFEIGNPSAKPSSGTVNIAGYIRNIKNGEAITSVDVTIDGSNTGVSTDKYGYFTIALSPGRHTLFFNSMGMKNTKRELLVHSNGRLDVEMQDDIPTLKTVVIVAEKNSNVRRMQMGLEQLNIKTIEKVPVLMGEPDVLRVLLTLPGVTSVGEASTGYNVRGGSADQNLILFNNATIYNPSHLFGFFSAFNPDVVKNVELYKSSIPEKYGGRLSSVLDVSAKEGNTKKWTGNGGIGVLTSKLTVEGPLAKDKTSIILGGRTSYSDWILTKIPDSDYKNSKASFYDVDVHINHEFDRKNSLYIGGYLSKDKFKLANDTLYSYGNKNLVVGWKHIFNNKLVGNFGGGIDYYNYGVEGDKGTINGFNLDFNVRQLHANADFTYSPNNRHQLSYGLSTVHYRIHPGSYQPDGDQSLAEPDVIDPEQALETAVYVGDKFDLTKNLSINAGLRYSMFNYLGPQEVNSYVNGLPRDPSTVTETTDYGKGKIINTYHGPEIRLALRYSLSENSSFKASFNTLRQYIHLLSNSTSISPTDIWKLSDPNIQPQVGKQFSIGYYHNFNSNTIETSVELYYKTMKHYLDYKSGAQLVLNPHVETDVINTRGRAYGIEFLLKKVTGKLNGWVSYTYSRTELQQDDPIAGQVINNGEYYPANFDKPHNLNVILNYRFTHRYSVSFNTIYNTGRPITLPIAVFDLAGTQRLYYSDRNKYRIPDYFRMDFSVNVDGNHNLKQWVHTSWTVGVYNLTGRKNPYSIYFVEENGAINGYQLSIIGTVVPYLTINFRF